MKRFDMKYGRKNIEISRTFDTPGGKVVISRSIAKEVEGWEEQIAIAKKAILNEAQTKFGLKKQVRHYNKKEEVI